MCSGTSPGVALVRRVLSSRMKLPPAHPSTTPESQLSSEFSWPFDSALNQHRAQLLAADFTLLRSPPTVLA